MICVTCNIVIAQGFMCDRSEVLDIECESCFAVHKCEELHPEDCMTIVCED